MRKLLCILVVLAGALCWHMTRPATIHEKVGAPSRPAVQAQALPAGTPRPGWVADLPQPLQLFWQGWHIRDIARSRIPREDWVPLDQISPWLPKAQVAVEDKRDRKSVV